jgi:DNA invertase Pin-like site-specific DNA recombinase
VGYKRVSSLLQNTDRRLDGEELGKVNEDKVSGKDTNRPALKEAMQFVRDGDVFVVHSMDRLARNLEDLKGIVKELTGRGVKVQ